MPHSPLAASEILIQVTPRMFSPSSGTNHLKLLLGIENLRDEMNFHQWHCRPP
jgi:hypothetical protein